MPVRPPPGSQVQVLAVLSPSHVIPVVDLNRPDLHHKQAISPGDLSIPVEDPDFITPVFPAGSPQSLTGAGDLGAINLTSAQTKITTASPGSTATLAAANVVGLNKYIRLTTASGGNPLTVTIEGAGFSTFTLDGSEAFVHLMWGQSSWFVVDSTSFTFA